MTIGIFDSGIGGLGIFQEIKKLMPNEQILYLADTTNCPYGEKSEQQIKQICLENSRFLIKKGANIIVVACNTGSTIALEYLRSKYNSYANSNLIRLRKSNEVREAVTFVGVVPVVKTCSEVSNNKRIGILATKATVGSEYLHNLVNQYCPESKGYKVYYQAANELVELVENISINSKFQFEIFNQTQNSNFKTLKHLNFNKNLKPASPADRLKIKNYQLLQKFPQPFIDARVDVVALGCTHFPFLRKQIEQIMGSKVRILDSNGAVARQVYRIVTGNKVNSNKGDKNIKYKFYTTGDSNKFKIQIKNLIDLEVGNVDKVNI